VGLAAIVGGCKQARQTPWCDQDVCRQAAGTSRGDSMVVEVVVI